MSTLKKWFIVGIIIGVAMTGIGGKISAYAAIVDYPPQQESASQNIAANVPAQGNVWTGVAQSFIPEDTNTRCSSF